MALLSKFLNRPKRCEALEPFILGTLGDFHSNVPEQVKREIAEKKRVKEL